MQEETVTNRLSRWGIGPRIFEPEGVALEASAGLGFAALKERFFARAKSVKAARIQAERVRVRMRVPPL